MRRLVLVAATFATSSAMAHPRFHGRVIVRPPVFAGGAYFYPPWPPYPVYPYGYPYPPPPWEPGPPPERGPEPPDEELPDENARTSYGLVRIRGAPDGADIDLDGRFWLVANALGMRWLALPEGEHVIAVRAERRDPIERRVVITAGKTHIVHVAVPPG